MVSYRLTDEAVEDLSRIYRYGLQHYGKEQADIYFDEIYEQFEKIAEYPNQYQIIEGLNKNYRRCVFGVDCIYYTVREESVLICRIFGQQDAERWL